MTAKGLAAGAAIMAAAIAGLWAGAGRAQTGDAGPPPADWDIPQIVVTGHPAGPAMWKIEKGDSVVWVIGIPPSLPEHMAWDQGRLSRVMAGAHALLTPPQATVGIGSAIAILTHMNLPGGHTLQDTLPPALYARFRRTAQAYGLNPALYEHSRPIFAALRLQADAAKSAGIAAGEPGRSIADIARAAHVPVKVMARYRIADAAKKITDEPEEDQEACLSGTLDGLDYTRAHGAAAADAWAHGDLAALRANTAANPGALCIGKAQWAQDFVTQAGDDAQKAVEDALATPGKTIIVLPLDPLLRHGAALERLQAEGMSITSPPG